MPELKDTGNKEKNRAVSLRTFIGVCWFFLFFVAFFLLMIKGIAIFSNYVASGQEAVDLDRALSEKAGGTIGIGGFIVIALLTAKFSISGKLPGTSKYKTNN